MLRWTVDAGADEAVGETPRDRFAETAARAAAKSQTAAVPPAAPRKSTNAEPNAPSAPRPVRRPASVPIEMESPDAAMASARDLATACATLDDLRAAMAGFDGCSLRHTAKNLVFGDGSPAAPVMFVGEGPGTEEDRTGLPFVGASGQLLDRMIGAIGLDRTGAYIANIIPWRPPGNRNPTSAEVAVCLPFIRRHIELVGPRVLVLVGGTAASALLERSEGVTRLRGRWLTCPGLGETLPALAIYHPAYLLRQPALKAQAWRDLLAIKARLADIQDPRPGQ